MSSLFVLTFMFSTPAFCLGLLNPQWVGLGTRKRATALYGGLMAVSFLLVGVTAGKRRKQFPRGCWPQLNWQNLGSAHLCAEPRVLRAHLTFLAALQRILPGLEPGGRETKFF
jgi:hypothetical protein